MENRKTKKGLEAGNNYPICGDRAGDVDPRGGAPDGRQGRQVETRGGTSGVRQNLKSGFLCDICRKEMLIAEAHHEIPASDFPVCDECWLEDAIRKGAGHE